MPLMRVVALFSESNTRFLCEVEPANAAAFEKRLADVPLAKFGSVNDSDQVDDCRSR